MDVDIPVNVGAMMTDHHNIGVSMTYYERMASRDRERMDPTKEQMSLLRELDIAAEGKFRIPKSKAEASERIAARLAEREGEKE